MKSTISTRGVDVSGRSRHWHNTIARTYFPLDLTFQRPEAFDGELSTWDLGNVSLSRLTSDPLIYRRLPKHFREPGPEEFLVTLPAKSELRFVQGGKEVRANPGAFFIERSHEPYEFSHAEQADLWVMKLSKEMLGGRIRAPDRFCSLQFDATNGANGLFVDMVHLIPARYDSMTEETRSIVGRQLVDLLALASEVTPQLKTVSVRAGIDEIILKPMSPKYLLERVQSRLRQRAPQPQSIQQTLRRFAPRPTPPREFNAGGNVIANPKRAGTRLSSPRRRNATPKPAAPT